MPEHEINPDRQMMAALFAKVPKRNPEEILLSEKIQAAPLECEEVSMRTPEEAFEEWFNLNLNARKNSQTLYREWEDKKEFVRNVFLTGYQTAVTDRESSVFYSGAFAE